MKLNWFSPLPPAQTGIADYTAQLLPFLCAQAEVTLWTDQEQWDRSLEKLATVRPYRGDQISWHELNQADLTVYHMGNNRLTHGGLWQISRQHPGLVILHDLHLHHFIAGMYLCVWQDPGSYVNQLTRCCGPLGAWAAHEFLQGRVSIDWMSLHFPVTELALEQALGVVVHTSKCRRAVNRHDRWPVLCLPLPYAASSQAQPAKKGPALRPTTGAKHQLIMFGHIGKNRCPDQILQALAQFPWRDHFHLDVFGGLEDGPAFQEQIRKWNLSERVHLHGHVSEAILEAALASADLAINLRYPTMGEASHSQLRIFSHALPSVVTRVGWYAGLPHDVSAKVRPGQEVADLQQHLLTLLQDPEYVRDMGLKGRQFLERYHTPQAYVRNLVEFADQVSGHRCHLARKALVERAGSVYESWVSGECADRINSALEQASSILVPSASRRTAVPHQR